MKGGGENLADSVGSVNIARWQCGSELRMTAGTDRHRFDEFRRKEDGMDTVSIIRFVTLLRIGFCAHELPNSVVMATTYRFVPCSPRVRRIGKEVRFYTAATGG